MIKKKTIAVILSTVLIGAFFPVNASFATEGGAESNLITLEDENLTEEEAFEYYGFEDEAVSDEDESEDSEPEGEEEPLDDMGIDIPEEEDELGLSEEEFDEDSGIETEMETEDEEELNATEPEDDGDSIDGYEEIDVSEEDNPEESVDDEGNGLAAGGGKISGPSTFEVGVGKTGNLIITFSKKCENLYLKVQDTSVCTVQKGTASSNQAVLKVTGKKRGGSTYITIKTKFFGLITKEKLKVLIKVPNIQTSPASELNVVKNGVKPIKISYSNASGLYVKSTISNNSKDIIGAKFGNWNGKNIKLNVQGKKTGTAYLKLTFKRSKSGRVFAEKIITVKVRPQPSINASKKSVDPIVGQPPANVTVSWGKVYGEGVRLVPSSTNKKAFQVLRQSSSKSSANYQIKGLKKGKGSVTFSLKSKNSGNVLAKTIVSVEVSKPSLKVAKAEVTVEAGKTAKILCEAGGMSGAYSFDSTATKNPANINVWTENRNGKTTTLAIAGKNAGTSTVKIRIKKGKTVCAEKSISVTVKPAGKPSVKLSTNTATVSVGGTTKITATLKNMPTGQIQCSSAIISGNTLLKCSKPSNAKNPKITLTGLKTGTGKVAISVYSKGKLIASASATVQVKAVSAINATSYSFENFSGSEGAPSKTVCKKMFKGEHWKVVYNAKNNGRAGNCFGMATTAGILRANNGIYPNDFRSSATLAQSLSKSDQYRFSDWGKWKPTVREWIQAMQITCFATQVFSSGTSYYHYGCSVGDLVAAVRADLGKGCYTEISFFHKQIDSGHAVLAIGFENVNSNQDRILLYDSSYPLKTRYLTLNKNGNGQYTGWNYAGKYSNYSEKKYALSYITYDGYMKLWNSRNTFIPEPLAIASNSGLSEDEQVQSTEENTGDLAGINFVCINSEDFSIMDVDDNVVTTIQDGVLTESTIDGIHIVRQMDEEGDVDEVEKSTLLYLPIDFYVFKNNDTSLGTFDVICANIDLSTSVETEGDIIALCADDSSDLASAVLETSEGEDYSISLGSSREGEPESMEWTGVGTGDTISIAQENGVLSMCNNEGAEMSVSDDNKEPRQYTVIATAEENGNITPEGNDRVWEGENQEYLFEPDKGYKVKNVEVDGKNIGPAESYTFEDVQTNHSIRVSFTKVVVSEAKDNGKKSTVSGINKSSILKGRILGISQKTFNGKTQTQRPVVKVSGKTLNEKTDYVIAYKNNKNVGIATITIIGTGKYVGRISKNFRINPKGTKLTKLKKGKKKVTVKWKKQPVQITGYQIRYSTKANFASGVKMVTISKPTAKKKVIKKLKSKKKYYVQIRTFKKVNGKIFCSAWSKTKAVKVK